jgi:hypothetical protein
MTRDRYVFDATCRAIQPVNAGHRPCPAVPAEQPPYLTAHRKAAADAPAIIGKEPR